jgi:hypothetical protein
MHEGTRGTLAKVICWATAASALVLALPAFSQEAIASLKKLGHTLEKAATCNKNAINIFSGAEFDGAHNDPKRQLEALGVSIANESRHGGETVYRFPAGVEVFGHEASEALFFDQSTTLFFVRLRSDPDQLRAVSQTLRLAAVPKGNPEGYGYFNEFDVRYIRKLTGSGGAESDAIFGGVGIRDRLGYIVIGCQSLAW